MSSWERYRQGVERATDTARIANQSAIQRDTLKQWNDKPLSSPANNAEQKPDYTPDDDAAAAEDRKQAEIRANEQDKGVEIDTSATFDDTGSETKRQGRREQDYDIE